MNLGQLILKRESIRMWDSEYDYKTVYFNDFIGFSGINFDIKLTFYMHYVNANLIRILTHIRIFAY